MSIEEGSSIELRMGSHARLELPKGRGPSGAERASILIKKVAVVDIEIPCCYA